MLPMYLGVEAVLAKSFARIHKENLINYGLLPLQFEREDDYDQIQQGDQIMLDNVRESIQSGCFTVRVPARNISFPAVLRVSEQDKVLLLEGGALNHLAAHR